MVKIPISQVAGCNLVFLAFGSCPWSQGVLRSTLLKDGSTLKDWIEDFGFKIAFNE